MTVTSIWCKIIFIDASFVSLVAVVGLEKTIYEVSDDVGVVTVCAIVYIPDIICPIQFAFNVTLSTSDERAGICMHYFVLYMQEE